MFELNYIGHMTLPCTFPMSNFSLNFVNIFPYIKLLVPIKIKYFDSVFCHFLASNHYQPWPQAPLFTFLIRFILHAKFATKFLPPFNYLESISSLILLKKTVSWEGLSMSTLRDFCNQIFKKHHNNLIWCLNQEQINFPKILFHSLPCHLSWIMLLACHQL